MQLQRVRSIYSNVMEMAIVVIQLNEETIAESLYVVVIELFQFIEM